MLLSKRDTYMNLRLDKQLINECLNVLHVLYYLCTSCK